VQCILILKKIKKIIGFPRFMRIKKKQMSGAWMAQSVKPLPSAQVMIPEFWD